MGGALTKKNKDENRFLFRGWSQSGKSLMLYRLMFGEVCPDMTYQKYGGNLPVKHEGESYIAWDDNSGRTPERFMFDKFYYGNTKAFVYVIDCATDKETREVAIDVLNDHMLQYEKLQDSVLMVAANKQDLEGAISAQQLEDEIKNICTLNMGITVFVMPTSVITGEGLQLAFDYFWTLMKLNKHKVLKPGLLPSAWMKAEQQLATSNFDDITTKQGWNKHHKNKMHKSFAKTINGILAR